MLTARKAAYKIVRSDDYVRRWFSAENFFNTKYTSEVLNDCYFITCDAWMSSDIWALRHITGDGIDTIHSCNTEQGCLDALEEVTV